MQKQQHQQQITRITFFFISYATQWPVDKKIERATQQNIMLKFHTHWNHYDGFRFCFGL